MTDKEFKHLGKGELIEIIYELKKEEERLKGELAQANAKLEERNIKINTSGSIAEAAININGVFEAAQKAADQYLEQVRVANEDTEEKCQEMYAMTELECRKRIEETDREINKRWALFQEKTETLINAHAELTVLLGNASSKK